MSISSADFLSLIAVRGEVTKKYTELANAGLTDKEIRALFEGMMIGDESKVYIPIINVWFDELIKDE